MINDNLNCSVLRAIGEPGASLLDDWIPLDARIPGQVGSYYQPNRYCYWETQGDDQNPARKGFVFTKYCSRKLRRTWSREAQAGRLELIYLVEAPQAVRRAITWIRYVVAPITQESAERLTIRLGKRISMWPRDAVEIALKQGGVILNPNGTEFGSLESFDQYMVGYHQMKVRSQGGVRTDSEPLG